MTATPSSLMQTLFIELFQTEESALAHPKKEAERLVGTPPAAALLAVSQHASDTRTALDTLAKAEGLSTSNVGSAIGDALSAVRKFVLDPTVSREKSYRGTLIGMHHGVDVVRLVRAVAIREDRPAIRAFCDAWLDTRPALVAQAVMQLAWFADHPDLAQERATTPLTDDA